MAVYRRDDPRAARRHMHKACHISLEAFDYLLEKIGPIIERESPENGGRGFRLDVVKPEQMLM
eukprot:9035076-Prorocentrum_lima.AAC.1